jgi:hypothetical protein
VLEGANVGMRVEGTNEEVVPGGIAPMRLIRLTVEDLSICVTRL